MYVSDLVRPQALPPTPTQARRELQSLLRRAKWDGDVDSVVLAVHEALMNSLRHAGGATSACAEVRGAAVVVEICDSGPGFDINRHASQPPDPLAESGRGLWLICQIADSWGVEHSNGETCLRLEFEA